MAERLTVAQEVAGSKPVGHPPHISTEAIASTRSRKRPVGVMAFMFPGSTQMAEKTVSSTLRRSPPISWANVASRWRWRSRCRSASPAMRQSQGNSFPKFGCPAGRASLYQPLPSQSGQGVALTVVSWLPWLGLATWPVGTTRARSAGLIILMLSSTVVILSGRGISLPILDNAALGLAFCPSGFVVFDQGLGVEVGKVLGGDYPLVDTEPANMLR